jgi:hypothetical protein
MEVYLAACCGWVALNSWLWPDDFGIVYHAAITLSPALGGFEFSWASYCGIAAALTLAGLACRFWSMWERTGAWLTISGLFMSVVFWTIVAVLVTQDNPHSVSPVMIFGMAIGAALQLSEWKQRPEARR